MQTTTTTTTPTTDRSDAAERVHVANKLFKTTITATASDALKAKIATIQEMAEAGWEDAEIGMMLNISKSWTGMLRRDVTFFFYCGACGSQVQTKRAACRCCGNNGDDALRADRIVLQ